MRIYPIKKILGGNLDPHETEFKEINLNGATSLIDGKGEILPEDVVIRSRVVEFFFETQRLFSREIPG